MSHNELFEENFDAWLVANGVYLGAYAKDVPLWESQIDKDLLRKGVGDLVNEQLKKALDKAEEHIKAAFKESAENGPLYFENEDEEEAPKLPSPGVHRIHASEASLYGFPDDASWNDGWMTPDGRTWVKGRQVWFLKYIEDESQ